jgi:hypothetical protein
MILISANNASTQLGANISSGTTTIPLATGTGALFPSPAAGQFFTLTLNDALTGNVYEICYCTSRTGDNCTVTRGQEGTSARSWLIGDFAYNALTAGNINFGGQLLNISIFLSSTTYSPTSGTNKVFVQIQAAGGASGGSPATTSGQASSGAGGGAGAYLEKFLTTGFSGASIIIGAAGVGVAGGTGGNAANTSFTSTYVANGGKGGGTAGPAGTGTSFNATGGAGGTASTSGDINFAGAPGNAGIVTAGNGIILPRSYAPTGGNSFGYGGAPNTETSGTAAVTGESGGPSFIRVWEYS